MKKYLLIVFTLSFFTAIYSCKKDPPCNFTNVNQWDSAQFQQYDTVPDTFANCTHSGFDPGEYRMAGFDYLNPCFNPNNASEICFIRRDNLTNNRQVCSYNFETKALKVLASNAYFDTDWSSGGWIAFTGNDFQIWKVKDSGDSLQKLTDRNFECHLPRWYENGNKLIFYEFSSNQYRFIIDANGNIIDTLINVNGYFSRTKNHTVLTASGLSNGKNLISIYNLENKQTASLFTYDNSANPYGQDFLTDVLWGDDGNIIIIITTYAMLYYTPSGQLIAGKQIGGRTKMYIEGVTYSNRKIVASRTNRWAVSEHCDIGTQTDLYMIDLDEQIPRRILLPE